MVGGEQLMGSTLDCVGVTLGQGVAGCVDGGKAGPVWIGDAGFGDLVCLGVL